MADDLDELGRRLDRIEDALRRPPEGPTRTPAGPEIRSARSIVNRVDDVWVAVTEGNDRLVTAVESLRTEFARLAAALVPPDTTEDESDQLDQDSDPDQQREPGSWKPKLRIPESGLPRTGSDGLVDQLGDRLSRIEEALADIAGPNVALGERLDRIEQLLAHPPTGTADTPAEVARLLAAHQAATEALDGRLGRMEEALARVATEDGSDPAVHLRLNRVEEALAGIAGRLEELAAASRTAARSGADDADGNGVQAAVDALGSEVRRLVGRVEGLAQALEAPAVRSNDGTLVDRVGRLRDQFRR